MAKVFLYALSILKKHMTELLRINFGRFCRSMALMVSKSFQCRPDVFFWVNGKQSKPFRVDVGLRLIGLRRACVLSPLFFIV